MGNDKGFAETIRMVIIVSFIAVVYMMGIYVWQHIETSKKVTRAVLQMSKVLAANLERKANSTDFNFNVQGGCANVYVYSFNKERTVSLVVEADIKKLNILNKKKSFYKLPAEDIVVKLYKGDFLGHLHCNKSLTADLLEHEVLEIQSGEIGIMLYEYNLIDQYLEDIDYRANIALRDIVFFDNDGNEIFIDQYIFDDVSVGWIPK